MAENFDDYSPDGCRGFSLLRTWYLYILDELTHSKDQADIIVQRFFQDGEYDLFTPDRKRFRLWHVDVVPGGVAPSLFRGSFGNRTLRAASSARSMVSTVRRYGQDRPRRGGALTDVSFLNTESV